MTFISLNGRRPSGPFASSEARLGGEAPLKGFCAVRANNKERTAWQVAQPQVWRAAVIVLAAIGVPKEE